MIDLETRFVGEELARELRTFCEQAEPHRAILPERKLAAQYGISHGSVRRVLDALLAERLIYKVQGKGNFVAERTHRKPVSVATLVYADSWGNVTHPHYARRLEGLTAAARRLNYRLEVLDCGPHLEHSERLYADLARRDVAGLIIPWLTPERAARIEAINPLLQIVATATRRPAGHACAVGTDYEALGAQAIEYLARRGTRRPRLVAVSPATVLGARECAAREGLDLDIVEASTTGPDEAVLVRLRQGSRDGLAFDDDVVARHLLRAVGQPACPTITHANVGDVQPWPGIARLEVDGYQYGQLIVELIHAQRGQQTFRQTVTWVRPRLVVPAEETVP